MNLSFKTFVFGAVALSFCVQTRSYADRDLVQERQKRLKRVKEDWSEPKVMLNIHHRVPIYDTLGFLAATYDDMEKFSQLVERLRPIADKVKTLSGGTLSGRSFPASLDSELTQDRNVMFSEIGKVYGSSVVTEVKSYIRRKQGNTEDTKFFGLLE